MKSFSTLAVVFGILAGAVPVSAKWTKVAASPDSIRTLASAYITVQGDVATEATISGKRDSIFTLGAAPSWGKGLVVDTSTITAVAILNNRCFAGTSKGKVFKRDDCVQSWYGGVTVSGGSAVYVLSGSIVNLFAGTAIGVSRSTNSGFSWASISTGLPMGPVKALAAFGDTVRAVTDSGLYVSSNAGATWSSKGYVHGKAVVRVLTGLRDRLFAATDSGIFRSRDNGSTWTGLNNGFPNKNTYGFVDGGAHLFVANAGGVYQSLDTGATWSILDSGITSGPVYALSGVQSNIYAGNDAGVWVQSFVGLVTSIDPPSVSKTGFHVQGSHIVSFTLTATSRVTLEAYTLTGTRAAVLLDERLPVGSHRRDLRPSLRAGLYIYLLKVGGVAETQKVLLTR